MIGHIKKKNCFIIYETHGTQGEVKKESSKDTMVNRNTRCHIPENKRSGTEDITPAKILVVAASNFDPKTGFVVFLIPPQLMSQGCGGTGLPPLPLPPSAIHCAVIVRLATGRCVLSY